MSPKGLPGSSKKNIFAAVIEVGCKCGVNHKVRISGTTYRKITCWNPRCSAVIEVYLGTGRNNYRALVEGQVATYSQIVWQE